MSHMMRNKNNEETLNQNALPESLEANDPEQAKQDEEDENVKFNLKQSSKIFYTITHTIHEEIKEQPKML